MLIRNWFLNQFHGEEDHLFWCDCCAQTNHTPKRPQVWVKLTQQCICGRTLKWLLICDHGLNCHLQVTWDKIIYKLNMCKQHSLNSRIALAAMISLKWSRLSPERFGFSSRFSLRYLAAEDDLVRQREIKRFVVIISVPPSTAPWMFCFGNGISQNVKSMLRLPAFFWNF